MHYCGNIWHDIAFNALWVACAIPLLRVYARRARNYFSTKEQECAKECNQK